MDTTHRTRTLRQIGESVAAIILFPLSLFVHVLVWILCALDEPSALKLGRRLASPFMLPSEYRRRGNLQRVFLPLGRTKAQCRHMSERHRSHIARTIVETVRLLKLPADELQGRIAFQGEEHLVAALSRGRGVLLVGDHMGNIWYLRALLGSKGYRVGAVTFKQALPGLETRLNELRARFHINATYVGEGGSKAAAQAFERNEIFTLSFDSALPQRKNHSTWVPFGHAAIEVDTGPALLALSNDVPVLRVNMRRAPDNTIVAAIHPETRKPDTGDLQANIRTLLRDWTDSLYKEITQRPEEWWFWGFIKMNTSSNMEHHD